MPQFDPQTSEVHLHIVYYGPPASGKLTSIKYLHQHIDVSEKDPLTFVRKSDMHLITCSFLLSPAESQWSHPLRFFLSAVSGSNLYDEDRLSVLEKVDGIMFVADTNRMKLAQNQHSFKEMMLGLRKYHANSLVLPLILQYNKQDLPEKHRLPTPILNQYLNILNRPYVESVAWCSPRHHSSWQTGDGIIRAFSLLQAEMIKRLPS
jgi:mutual gliding-motility protein MglA